MRIVDWSLHFYTLPYKGEVVWATAIEQAGTFCLLHLRADNGAEGIAEGTIKATWSGVSARSLAATIEDVMMPRLKKVDVADEKAVQLSLSRVPENRLAKGMVDIACWGLRAMASAKPLWRLLGGTQQVDVMWALSRQTPQLMAREAADMCARHGFRTLKLKGGTGVEVDLAGLREVRAAVGPEVTLLIDSNSAYPSSEALSYVRAIARAGAAVAEDPCPLQPDQGFAALQSECGLPILIDRSCTSVEDARHFLDRGATALGAKPGRFGISETRNITALATRRGAKVAIGLYAESALGSLLSLQQAGAVPAPQRLLAAEQSFYLSMTDQVLGPELAISEGRVSLPDTPDLASLVDWQKVAHYAFT